MCVGRVRDSWLMGCCRVRVQKLGRKAEDVQSGVCRWLSEVEVEVGGVMEKAMEGQDKDNKREVRCQARAALSQRTCHITAQVQLRHCVPAVGPAAAPCPGNACLGGHSSA